MLCVTIRYPEGESYLDLLQRLQPVFDDIQELGMPVVIISHQVGLNKSVICEGSGGVG